MQELEWYGILLDESNEEEIERKTTQQLEQIIANDIYYISACGSVYVTSKTTLSKIEYFRAAISGHFKQHYTGTAKDPYCIDVPPNIMSNIISYLRDSRVKLTNNSIKILGM